MIPPIMARVHPSLIETNTPSGKRHRKIYDGVEKAWRKVHPGEDPSEPERSTMREVMTLTHEFERLSARAADGHPPTPGNMVQLTCELSRLRVALGLQDAPSFADLDGPIFRQFARDRPLAGGNRSTARSLSTSTSSRILTAKAASIREASYRRR